MRLTAFCLSLSAAIVLTSSAHAATLYSENFDIDASPNWTTNNNSLGTNAANFFYNYSAVGIPSAPHSTGGSTIGMKLGANLDSATAPASGSIPGITASPTGKSFTGNYTLRFDWWSNYIGPLDVGATGSTMLSEFGIMSSGTSANYPGAVDSVMFAATGDGQSSSDFRMYSSERNTSYDIFATSGNALDTHATYAAGNRNSSAALYTTTFPAGATAPGSQASDPTQTLATPAGAAGFRWHDVSIIKAGPTVQWVVDGVLLGTVDTALFTGTLPAGSNILFGMADTNNTTNSSAANLAKLQFTLIDNIQVTDVVPEPSSALLCILGLVGFFGARSRTR